MNKKILVAEDEVISARFLEAMISKLIGITPDMAFSDLEILQKCSENKYDLVILDINLGPMSKLNGIQILKHLQSDERAGDTRFIACTAYATIDEKQNYLDLGFSDLIIKPYDVYQFVKYIESIIKMSNIEN